MACAPLFSELPLSAQTAHAQLLDAAFALNATRSVADLSGSFSAKLVRGEKYWYFQYTEPSGKLRQVFVGPDAAEVHALIAARDKPAASKSLSPQARACAALGCRELSLRHLRVIIRIAEYGFFKAGVVLGGAHAFLAYGNMLGVQWRGSSQKLDATEQQIALVLPRHFRLDTDDPLNSLENGFLPVAGLSGKAGAVDLNPRKPGPRLDFLVPLRKKGDDHFLHCLGLALQPRKSAEFLLDKVQRTVVFAAGKSVIVGLPDPARFALHNLIVYGERDSAIAERRQGLEQAAQLLVRLRETRAWEIEEAWGDLVRHGEGWIAHAKRGRGALVKAYPELEFADLLSL